MDGEGNTITVLPAFRKHAVLHREVNESTGVVGHGENSGERLWIFDIHRTKSQVIEKEKAGFLPPFP